MGNITGVQANVQLFKGTYKSMLTDGEAAIAHDFVMRIDGYPDLTYLVQTANIPTIKREPIEIYGPLGTKFMQQGKIENAVEMPLTFKEVITGKAYAALTQWVRDKEYHTITLELTHESLGYAQGKTWLIEDAWMELDNVDLSVEDSTPVKPSGTLHGHYFLDIADGSAGVDRNF